MEGRKAGSDLIRAVIDTSSLFAPTLRRELQQLTEEGLFVGIWSPWIIAELYRVLTWRWIKDKGMSAESQRECSRQAKRMMEVLLPSFELVNPLRFRVPATARLRHQALQRPTFAASI